MADEAEKLINLSLCKMAESRSVRRGGTSLHKHLLISTVLTKARSAYFETWYMGEGEVSYGEAGSDGTSQNISLNASFQESDFPLDDSDDDDEDDSVDDPFSIGMGQNPNPNDNSMCDSSSSSSEDDHESNPNNNMIDPRFFVEVESEIELPSDILNCVEKLGNISEHMSFTVNSASSIVSSSSSGVDKSDTSESREREQATAELTYLDLDSSQSLKDLSDNENNNNNNKHENENIFGQPLNCSTPNPSKRRRGWSLEEEDSDNEQDNENDEGNISMTSPKSRQKESSRNGLNSLTNLAKRLRFTPEGEDSGMESPSKSQIKFESRKGIIDSEFRTKKSHFEEDEQEESSEDDPFLGDALGQCPLDGDSKNYDQNHHSRDRRVPSTSSSSGSSSDEDGDAENNSMEVDQITNLVQFISFNKSNQNHTSSSSATVTKTSSSSSTGSSSITTTTTTTNSSNGLIRSMSSPDLCGLAAASRSSSNSANNAKDLFSFVSSSSNSHISNHRVLTMKV